MKLKLKDIKEVIGDLVVETWTKHSFQRRIRMPTQEEMEKMSREFGIKIEWLDCIHDPEYLLTKWNSPTEKGNSLFYFINSLILKDVHSTLDDDYGLLLAGIHYSNPFDPPQEYRAIAYGPLELLVPLRGTVQSHMFGTFPNDMGEGTEMAYKVLKSVGFYDHVGITILDKVISTAQNNKIPFKQTDQTPKQKNHWMIMFKDAHDSERVIDEVVRILKKELPAMYTNIGWRLDRRGDNMDYIYAGLHNKYTGFTLANINFFNVQMRWKYEQGYGGPPIS